MSRPARPPAADAAPPLWRPVYEARVVQTHRWRYELRITADSLRYGWEGGIWIHAYGSRAHAEAKAQRIVDRLNGRTAREAARDAAAETAQVIR